jgi:phosphoribosylglycinamide formyltransferase 2
VRPHDTGLAGLASETQSEFELHVKAILGLPVDVSLRTPAASSVIYGGIDQKGIGFTGLEKALNLPGVAVRLFGKPEAFVKRRMGVALASAKDTDSARNTAKLASSLIQTTDK